MRMRWLLGVALGLAAALAAPGALGAPYWVSYEGNDFPENEGWTHYYGDGNWPTEHTALRSIEGGSLVIDDLYDPRIFDGAQRIVRPEQVLPQAGESFVAEWRAWGDPRSAEVDSGVGIVRGTVPDYVRFFLGPAGMQLEVPGGPVTLPYEPGVFHSFRAIATGGATLALEVDGNPVWSGAFNGELGPGLDSQFYFGNLVSGASSLVRWDYVRFGIVPEPLTFPAFLLLCTYVYRTR